MDTTLAANLQALVRSLSNVAADHLIFAAPINQHLNRYTPSDRFATAVFAVLNRASGESIYVNAGHNPPLVSCSGAIKPLDATGVPLGLFEKAEYKSGNVVLEPGGTILLYTDGLTDSIAGDHPEKRLYDALVGNSLNTMSAVKSLVDPTFNEDDVKLLLIRRTHDVRRTSVPGWDDAMTFNRLRGVRFP